MFGPDVVQLDLFLSGSFLFLRLDLLYWLDPFVQCGTEEMKGDILLLITEASIQSLVSTLTRGVS